MTCTLAIVSLCLTFFVGAHAGIAEKIVGGTTASINEFPFQVSLRKYNQHFCGGSIISERHILTAAHCVRNLMNPPYTDEVVVTGSSMSHNSGQTHRVKRTDVHPGFVDTEASSYRNDLAVITLSDNITFAENQRKIDLPTSDVKPGETAMISGWGVQSSSDRNVSPNLMKVSMSIIPTSNCTGYTFKLYDEQFCAMQKKGVGICFGDSGGPLSANNQVIGIASRVIPCALGYPDIYTKVYAYKDWINGIMANS